MPTDASSTSEATHEQVAKRLHQVKQRYTPVRRSIIEALLEARRPLTVAELLWVMGSVPQSSAYRSLATFVDAQVLVRLQGSDGEGRFELCEDLTGHHHHHLVCSTCGAVADIEPSSRLERALGDAAAAARELGYVVTGHRFDLMGTCPQCHQGA